MSTDRENGRYEGESFCKRTSLWDKSDLELYDCSFTSEARSSLWNCDGVTLRGVVSTAPRLLKRCTRLAVERCRLYDGTEETDGSAEEKEELLTSCEGVVIERSVVMAGKYPLHNCKGVSLENSSIVGDYPAWECERLYANGSRIVGKDPLWYLRIGRLVDCDIEGDWPVGYAKSVGIFGCRFISDEGACFHGAEQIRVSAEEIRRVGAVRSGIIIARRVEKVDSENSARIYAVECSAPDPAGNVIIIDESDFHRAINVIPGEADTWFESWLKLRIWPKYGR